MSILNTVCSFKSQSGLKGSVFLKGVRFITKSQLQYYYIKTGHTTLCEGCACSNTLIQWSRIQFSSRCKILSVC